MEEEEFDLYGLLTNGKPKKEYRQSIKESSVIGYDDKFGDSSYDKEFFPKVALGDNLEKDLGALIRENRAQKQPWVNKAGALVGRASMKALTEVAKMPGVIGGAIAAPFAEEGQGWETAVNNSWIQAINNFSEDFNTDVLPVYVKKAVEEGNLWDNITAVDFWATEGADGIGYIASMLAPGALISKIGLGARVMKGVGKIPSLANKLDDTANVISKFKLNPESIDLVAQTTANTLFEAAAEAQGAGQAYEQKMADKLASGAISEQEYNKGKAEAMRNVFVSNAIILAGPNAIMSKMLWGKKVGKVGANILDDAGKPIAESTSLLGKAGGIAEDVAKATGREGFFEEGLQSTVEHYFTDKAAAGKDPSLTEIFSDLPEAYLEMLGSTEGQKAIFLGAFLGGGMQAFQGHKQREADKKSTKKILSDLEKVDSFFNIFNQEVYDEGTGQLNGAKVVEKLNGIAGTQFVSELYDKAAQQGNQELVDGLRAWSSGELAKSFIMNGEKGIAAFEEYLTKSSTMEDLAVKEQKEKDEIIKPILESARKLSNDYSLFQEFGEPFIDLKNDNATTADRQMFYDKLASDYLSKKNMSYFYDNKLKEAKDKRSTVLESLGLRKELVTEDETLVAMEKDNLVIKEINDRVRTYESLVKNNQEDLNDFWKEDHHNSKFNDFVNFNDKLREAQEEESQKQLEELKNNIEAATTEEELDQLGSLPNNVADKAIQKLIEKKRKEIQSNKATTRKTQATTQATKAEEQQAEKNKDESDSYDIGNWLANNKNVDEMVAITDDVSPKYFTSSGIVTEITDDYVEVNALDRQEVMRIPRNKKTNTTVVPEQEYQTEGSELHDSLIPKNNENGQEVGELEQGAKIISTDKATGEPFSYVSPAYISYEKEPINKKGHEVKFEINNTPGDNKNILKALNAYNNKDFSDPVLLIEYLPLNAVFAEGIVAPTETKPSTAKRQETWNKTSKLLRTKIVNSLINGAELSSLSTTVQGQFQGQLKVDTKDPNGKVKENSILDLHFLKGLSKEDKLKEVQKRLGFISKRGSLETLEGKTVELQKPQSAGELYMLIPMANGIDFPLKLNIAKISEQYADVLSELYALRLVDKDLDKSTRLSEIEDTELKDTVNNLLKSEISFIGKSKADITIKDITDLLVWDRTKNMKSRIGFTGAGAGQRMFVYGNPKLNGAEVNTPEEFDKAAFKEWLVAEKRQNINIKKKSSQDNKASIATNRKYLEYLLDNKILNTNAVVGENTPTFQGYTNIYLDTTNLKGEVASVTKEGGELEKGSLNANMEVYNRLRGVKTPVKKVAPVKPVKIEPKIQKTNKESIGFIGRFKNGEAKLLDKQAHTSTFIITKEGNNYSLTIDTNMSDYSLKEVTNQPDSAFNYAFEQVSNQQISNPKNTQFVIKQYPKLRLEGDTLTVIEKGKLELREGRLEVIEELSSEKLENNTEKVRKSQKDFVPLHEEDYSGPKVNVSKLLGKVQSNDKLSDEVTAKVVTELFKVLKDKGLIRIGRKSQALMKGDNNQKFNNLKKLAEEHKISVNDIITKCS